MENLSGIVAFVHTAEASSFVGASQRLGLSASAVGKSVARLEQHLGVRLLQRSTRRVSLTEDGERFYERCRQILDALSEAESMMLQANATPRGRLRVSLPTIGYRFLLPILPEFAGRYPEIDLELDFNDRLVDVIEGGFDAAIRSGELPDSQLMARRLGPFRFVLCASPAYLQRRGVPLVRADLAQHACLRFRFPTSGKLQAWSLRGLPDDAAAHFPSALTCNNMEALRGAAELGLGIAYMPDFLAREAIHAGTLRSVLAEHLAHAGQFSVVWPSNRQLSPKLRAFVDFLSERLFGDA
ncbi:LysR family transcriptional regulator [Paraburkholderia fynbosensis]|uniref:HTH-type transcriptional regulator PgrR n=1 Tax=Paraburkholderia fynbosensis TaxID=1200993 RepID=A0A6J5GIZ8_9BURK|nr:LysR family transcriptional regulator [Paraburkholderia fynbosensis]CAB3800262.1 HTH-type transcriptional regulator PgrR [Paraburkholderia fynbosensis]